ncbi:MAG: ATP-grasp domain-containing protein [Dermatophilaceae bacterium]|nr:ATP-grasp domain-containing protein [Dermatophilaceae bacterium]
MATSLTATVGPSVTMLVEGRYLSQAEPRGVTAALARRGVRVRTVVAENAVADVADPTTILGRDAGPHPVVCPRGRSLALLATLRALEAQGVHVIHRAATIDTVVDKVGMSARLTEAGVPTPRTWLGHPSRLSRRPDLAYPLLLKPVRGDNSRGIAVVDDAAQLRGLQWPEQVALAQPFHRGDAHDLKVYVAGPHVWAVRRRSPIHRDGTPTGATEPGVQVPVTAAARALAERCRAVFGLTLFGIDCVTDSSGDLLVVDVNEFPNYRGISGDVDEMLAEVVLGVLPAEVQQAGAERFAAELVGVPEQVPA